MSSDVFDPARRAMGEALKAVRERQGLTLRDVGVRLGMSYQGYQRHEQGAIRVDEERLARLAEAMQVTPAEISDEQERQMRTPGGATGERRATWDSTIPVWGRARAGIQGPHVYDAGEPEQTVDVGALFGPGSGALRVAGDSMIPWGEPGELVIFDRNRYPRRGHGCVVETKEGGYFVKLYERTDGSTLFVREFQPEERTVTFALSDVVGVYAVRFRGD